MNPQLYIFKRYEMKRLDSRRRISFVIVNADKAKEYPENFVCLLPTHKNSIINPVTKFSRLFGKGSLNLAKRLLTNALKDEDDPEIRAEIGRRLRLIRSSKGNRRDIVGLGRHFALDTLRVTFEEEQLRPKR